MVFHRVIGSPDIVAFSILIQKNTQSYLTVMVDRASSFIL